MAKKKDSGGGTDAAMAHPVQRRIEATTVCFTEEAAPAGQFAVHVKCIAEWHLEFRRGGGQRPYRLRQKRQANGKLEIADLTEIASAGACRV